MSQFDGVSGVIGSDSGYNRSIRSDSLDDSLNDLSLLRISRGRRFPRRAVDDNAVIVLFLNELVRQLASPTQVHRPVERHRSHHGRKQTAKNGSGHAKPPCIAGAHGSHEMASAG